MYLPPLSIVHTQDKKGGFHMKRFILTALILYAIFSIFRDYLLDGTLKLLLIPLGFAFISFMCYYAKLLLMTKTKDIRTSEDRRRVKVENLKKDTEKQEFLQEYDRDVKPLYHKGRVLFAQLMRERRLRSYEVKELKKVISSHLGSYNDFYHNYKFKNDANEIYVKMKNFNLDKNDWEEILLYLIGKSVNEPLPKKPKETSKSKKQSKKLKEETV